MVKYSIITVSYNSEDFIEDYLKSVLKYKPDYTEVIIVDSNSDDKTVDKIKKFNEINLIESKENLGFGKGNNLGSKHALGEYLFFLNPDTVVKGEFLEELVDFYKSDPGIGLVAPKLITPDGKIQASVSKLPTVLGAFKEYVLGGKNAYSQYIPLTDQPIEVEVVYGAAMLIKKDLFQRLGGFNEKYFMYYEDIEFCKRVSDLGFKIYYYPKVEITHLLGAAKSKKDRNMLISDSAAKYHGVFGAFFLQLIFLIPRLRRKLSLS